MKVILFGVHFVPHLLCFLFPWHAPFVLFRKSTGSILSSCLGNAIKAFGNGTDVGVWQPQPPIQPTVEPSTTRRGKAWTNSVVDVLTDVSQLGANSDSYHICGPLQVRFEKKILNFAVQKHLNLFLLKCLIKIKHWECLIRTWYLAFCLQNFRNLPELENENPSSQP